MGFRDDSESRRAKIDALLAERGEHEERIDALEARVELLEDRLQKQEVTLAAKSKSKKSAPKKSAPKKSAPKTKPVRAADVLQRRWRGIVVAGGLAILACGFGMFLSISESAERVTEEPAEHVPPVWWNVELQPTPVGMEEPSEHIPAPVPSVPASPAPRPLLTGQVTLAEGSTSVEVGASCEVHADVIDHMRHLIAPDGLNVRCGGEMLYRVGTRAPCRVFGQPEIFGGLFVFACEDRGIRGDRPEMVLRSAERTLRIWSETHGWNVTIELEQAAARVALQSSLEPDRGRGLPLPEATTLTLRVQGSLGEGGPSNNTMLTLLVTPSPRAIYNCDFVVREGRRLVGESSGRCVLDSQLNLIGINAGLSDRRRFGITMERGADVITIEGADGERSWHAQTLNETE